MRFLNTRLGRNQVKGQVIINYLGSPQRPSLRSQFAVNANHEIKLSHVTQSEVSMTNYP